VNPQWGCHSQTTGGVGTCDGPTLTRVSSQIFSIRSLYFPSVHGFRGWGGCGLVGRARVGNSVRPNLQILKFGRSGIYTVAQLTCGLLGTTQGFDHGFLLVSIRRLSPYVPSAAVRSVMLSQAMMQLSEGYPASTQPPEYYTPNKREATTAGMGIELKCRTAWIKAVTLSGQDLARGRAEPGLSLALRRRLWPSVR